MKHFNLAERVGFEPTEPVKVQRFSRPPDSTALAPLRLRVFIYSSKFRAAAADGRSGSPAFAGICALPQNSSNAFLPAVASAQDEIAKPDAVQHAC
jgi:hypothetical protein